MNQTKGNYEDVNKWTRPKVVTNTQIACGPGQYKQVSIGDLVESCLSASRPLIDVASKNEEEYTYHWYTGIVRSIKARDLGGSRFIEMSIQDGNVLHGITIYPYPSHFDNTKFINILHREAKEWDD